MNERSLLDRKWSWKDGLIDRLVREAGGSPARLIAWARAAGLRVSGEELAAGAATWYTAAEYLADRELNRWPPVNMASSRSTNEAQAARPGEATNHATL